MSGLVMPKTRGSEWKLYGIEKQACGGAARLYAVHIVSPMVQKCL